MSGTKNDGKQPLLSICIPTYNRVNKLKIAINAFIEAINGYENDVEIIISDNCSNDGTESFIESVCLKYPFIYYYKNKSNLGFNRNLFMLTDIYAKGTYCWAIGDDDYVDKDSIGIILKALKEHHGIKYFSLNYRIQKADEFNKFKFNTNLSRSPKIIEGSFAEVIDLNASTGNILATFMSSSIFFREDFSEYSKTIFSANSWDNFYSCFPNSYLMATLFVHEKSIAVIEPLITIIPDKKDWDDKIYLIFTTFLPAMLNYFISIGVKKRNLRKNIKLLLRQYIRIKFKNILGWK